jgi:hypothetical protein
VNPAWAAALTALKTDAITPILGERKELTEREWSSINEKLDGYRKWLASKGDGSVDSLGLKRVQDILRGSTKAAITELIAKDQALERQAHAAVKHHVGP